MADGERKDVKFMALAINADASKREEQLKGDKLAGGLHEIAELAAAQAAVPTKAEALAALHVSQHASRQAKAAIEAANDEGNMAPRAKVGTVEGKSKKANKAAKDAASVSWQAAQEAAKNAAGHSETAMREAMKAAELVPAKVQPSIVTISELSGKDALKSFCEMLGGNWQCVSDAFNSSDRIVTAYNSQVWELQLIDGRDSIISIYGRYLLTKLRMKANNTKNSRKNNNMVLAYFSVHLPHKEGKEKAYGCIKDAIKECCKDADLVIIGGDWNMTPQDIEDQFKDLTIPIDKSKLAFIEGYTNEAETAVIDNFALIDQRPNGSASFSAKKIMNEMQVEKYTTHAPIWAEVRFTPSSEE